MKRLLPILLALTGLAACRPSAPDMKELADAPACPSDPAAYLDSMLRLDGYADAATGTPEYNLHLSRQRADAVYRLLTEQYGIAPGRLQAQGIGGNGSPYDQAAWNRAVVVTVIEE